MKNVIKKVKILLVIVASTTLMSAGFSKKSETIKSTSGKYLFCEVSGYFILQGRRTNVMYTTNISQLECNPSDYEIEKQLKNEFSSITNQWNEATYRFERFDSYEEAEDWKNQRKNTGYRYKFRVIDDGVYASFYYKCD